MRAIRTARAAMLLILALATAPAAALAQEWKSYSYPRPAFAVQFPAPPSIEQDSFKGFPGQDFLRPALPMTRYVLRQDGIVYSVEVIDFSGAQTGSLATIAAAEKSFATGGKVTVAIDARINREFGRELSVAGDDASRSTVAIFFVIRQLVQLVAKSLPPNPLAKSADAIHSSSRCSSLGRTTRWGGWITTLGEGWRECGDESIGRRCVKLLPDKRLVDGPSPQG